MSISLASNFSVNAQLPIDSRNVVADITARNAIPSSVRYEGLTVYVTAAKVNYQLVSGILDANWTPLANSPLTTKGDLYGFDTAGNRFPVGADGQVVTADSTAPFGIAYKNAAGGGGSKNYLATVNGVSGNGDFETGLLGGWVMGNIPSLTNGIPVGALDLTGVTNTTTTSTLTSTGANIAINGSSNLISGKYDLVFNSAGVVGNCFVSPVMTLDPGDGASMLKLALKYLVPFGAGATNWSGTSLNSIGMAVWNVATSKWESTLTGNFNFTTAQGIGPATALVQSPASGAQYRVVIYVANTFSGGGTSLFFDDFAFGPQTGSVGGVLTGSQTYVANPASFGGFGTPAAQNLRWSRIGEELEVRGTFTVGTAAAANGKIPLPTGLSIDLSKFSTNAPAGFLYIGGNTSNSASLFVDALGSASTAVTMGLQGTTANTGWINGIAASSVTGSGTLCGVYFKVPIAGWGATSALSSDTDSRVNAAKGALTASTSVTALNAIPFNSYSIDTNAAMATTGYTVPVTGIWDVIFSGSTTTSTNPTMSVYKNGVVDTPLVFLGGANTIYTGVTIVSASAGDILTIRPDATSTMSVNTRVSYVRRSGPATVQTNESYSMSAFGGTTSVPGTSTATALVFTTVEKDTHARYSAGVYSIPIAGFYNVIAQMQYTARTLGTGGIQQLQLYKNGAFYRTIAKDLQSSITGFADSHRGALNLQCQPGDTLQLFMVDNTAGTLDGSSTNYFQVRRVGN